MEMVGFALPSLYVIDHFRSHLALAEIDDTIV